MESHITRLYQVALPQYGDIARGGGGRGGPGVRTPPASNRTTPGIRANPRRFLDGGGTVVYLRVNDQSIALTAAARHPPEAPTVSATEADCQSHSAEKYLLIQMFHNCA